jgi:hypothetical protein
MRFLRDTKLAGYALLIKSVRRRTTVHRRVTIAGCGRPLSGNQMANPSKIEHQRPCTLEQLIRCVRIDAGFPNSLNISDLNY